MKCRINNQTVTVSIQGEINSSNALDIEREIEEALELLVFNNLVLDFSEVTYISSAGLRVILKFRKDYPNLEIINVTLEVYDVFEMTGFTKMLSIKKKLLEITVDEATKIGEGRAGIVYRLSKDSIVKVYKRGNDTKEIERDLNLSRISFILGIPTAMTFDIVKVGERYAARYEMLDCITLCDAIKKEPKKLESYLDKYNELLLKINHTSTTEVDLPDKKQRWLNELHYTYDYLDEKRKNKLIKLINSIPDAKTFIHGDCHIKNIMTNMDELFLIDMGSLSTGYPIFEFAALFRTIYCFDYTDPGNAERFFDLDRKTIDNIFEGICKRYFKKFNKQVLNKIKLTALTYMISWNRRYDSQDEKRLQDALSRIIPLIDSLDDLNLPLSD